MSENAKPAKGGGDDKAFDRWIDRKLSSVFDMEVNDADLSAFEEILLQFETRDNEDGDQRHSVDRVKRGGHHK